MLTSIQCRILEMISPQGPDCCTGRCYDGKSKLSILLGDDFFNKVAGKTVIDFGCGEGDQAIEMAHRGAGQVTGIDICGDVLRTARQKARTAGLKETRCRFVDSTTEPADVIVSLDAFEHFADPSGILHAMNTLLRPGGEMFISFGPTWYHPLVACRSEFVSMLAPGGARRSTSN